MQIRKVLVVAISCQDVGKKYGAYTCVVENANVTHVYTKHVITEVDACVAECCTRCEATVIQIQAHNGCQS